MTSSKTLNYGRYMEKAMRGVMAEILGEVARRGLPGAHYFYITFETQHPGVDLPDWLRERYPSEMMIVLQEWFDDLAVMGDRFQVTLSFSDQPETLVIPFDAVKTFVDPSAKFGLKFDDHESDEMVLDLDDIADSDELDEDAADEDIADEDGPDIDIAGANIADRKTNGSANKAGPDDDKTKSSADVVNLDRFRKP